jgi:hypothetical protein
VSNAGERDSDKRLTKAFAAMPAVAAIVLAILYVVGAIAKIDELRGAGLDPRDVLTLIPIQQLLARGVGVSLQALLFAALAVVSFVVVELPKKPAVSLTNRVARVIAVVLLLGMLVFLLVFLPVVPVVLAVSVGIAAGVASRRGKVRPRVFMATLFAAALMALLVVNYFRPPLLATAVIHTNRGGTIRGGFVAEADGIWYVSEKKHLLTAIRGDLVASTVICDRPTTRGSLPSGRSLIGYVTGRNFLRRFFFETAPKIPLCP